MIQLGHERALANHIGLSDVLAMVAEFRIKDSETPVVLMGYANPIEVMGCSVFAEAAQRAGVDGVLTVDMPPEEASESNAIFRQHGLDTIFLIAPTTSNQRTEQICAMATGYIYYVSLKGVTGAGHLDTAEVESKVGFIKQTTDLPVCVGFGIKDADSARTIAKYADGVVVGSVLVDGMGECVGMNVRDDEADLNAESKSFNANEKNLLARKITDKIMSIVSAIAAGANP